MHENLAVHTKHIEQANVPAPEGFGLLVREVVLLKNGFQIGTKAFLHPGVAVQFVKEFLDVIEAHDTKAGH